MRLELAEPRHGWITLTVRIGGDEWCGTASYIVDCLTDLVSAALELTERRPARPVILFGEPATSRISFLDENGGLRLVITRHADLAAAQSDRNGTVSFTAPVAARAVARAIWAALRRLEGATSRETIEAGWQRPFPAREIAQLGERLR